MPNRIVSMLRSWEAFLAVILVLVVLGNTQLSPFYFSVDNLTNVFQLSVEKIIVVTTMTLIIINGEIDLSVASVMGLSASMFAWLYQQGVAAEVAILVCLGLGIVCGLFNAVWIAYFGLPSLAVTLATLIGYRGAARVLLENRSVGGFPDWFNRLGQPDLIGPLSAGIIIFIVLYIIVAIVLHFSAFGRYIYTIGNSKEAAQYAGVKVRQVKLLLFMFSSLVASLAGLLTAARFGSVRANQAEGYELEVITIVLLGGVSIFGGKGTMVGVGLSILIVLNLRNGMSLANVSGNTQTSVIGLLLILSVLIPNTVQYLQRLRPHLSLGRKAREAQASS